MNPYRIVYTTEDGFTNELTHQDESPEAALEWAKLYVPANWTHIDVDLRDEL